MILIQSFFVAFLLLQEISLVDCKHKKTIKIASTSPKITTKLPPIISLAAYCNYTECEAKGKNFCLCTNNNYPSHSTHWPVPKKDNCPSIGCSPSGKNCYCQWDHFENFNHWGNKGQMDRCECNQINCNNTECVGRSLSSGCYCYFGDKVIRTYDMPASKKCSNLLKEIGNHNGLYQCSGFSCKCDKYGDCVCKPPENMNTQTAVPKECHSEQCEKRSFEVCQCTYYDCFNPNGTCTTDVVFKKLPKSGICSGMLNSSYQCTNIGQKCSCKTDCDGIKTQYKGNSTTKSECVCVDVDPLTSSGACDYCQSYGSCICTYGEFAVRIPNSPKNCSALQKSQAPNTTKFDTCPYREGQVCECIRNPNTHQKQCFCRDTLKRIPPFNLKSNPHVCCKDDRCCIEHNELYCYCTNYANNTYVKKVSRSAIENLPKQEFDYNAVEKLCYAYGHPPDISCHTFGYTASCVLGFCNLKQINLYYTNVY